MKKEQSEQRWMHENLMHEIRKLQENVKEAKALIKKIGGKENEGTKGIGVVDAAKDMQYRVAEAKQDDMKKEYSLWKRMLYLDRFKE